MTSEVSLNRSQTTEAVWAAKDLITLGQRQVTKRNLATDFGSETRSPNCTTMMKKLRFSTRASRGVVSCMILTRHENCLQTSCCFQTTTNLCQCQLWPLLSPACFRETSRRQPRRESLKSARAILGQSLMSELHQLQLMQVNSVNNSESGQSKARFALGIVAPLLSSTANFPATSTAEFVLQSI
jgi:hypothetical protein